MNSEYERGIGVSAFLVGLMAGAAIGAGFGVLYAPRKGSELRERLADATTKASKKVSKTVDALSEHGRHLYGRARDVVPHLGEEINRATDAAAKGFDEGMNTAREKVSEARRA